LAIYYVHPQGSDANNGRSEQSPWQSVQKASAMAYAPGDQLLFCGRETYGPLTLENLEGTEEAPIRIGSYGRGRARFEGGRGHGIHLKNCSYVQLTEVESMGAGRKYDNDQGIGIWVQNCRHTQVKGAETWGYQRCGAHIEGGAYIIFDSIHAHDNGFAGITSGAYEDRQAERIYIGRCRALNNAGDPTIKANHSGSGIIVYGTKDALVEYCEAAYNGWDMDNLQVNGPVGIWTAVGAERITIQYCISHDNRTQWGKTDGGGFDFDGGTTDSVIQYCYSFNNDGCGYLLCQYTQGGRWENNTVRYSVSVNDGRGKHKASVCCYDGGSKETTRTGYVYNNVFVNSAGRDIVEGHLDDLRFYNNVFILKDGGQFIKMNRSDAILLQRRPEDRQFIDMTFQGNLYYSPDGRSTFDGYTSLTAWQKGTGQEILDGHPTGQEKNPGYGDPFEYEKITNPEDIQKLFAYQMPEASPLAKNGLPLQDLEIDPGSADYYGNPVPKDAKPDIGIHQKG